MWGTALRQHSFPRLPRRLEADGAKLNGIAVAGESEEAGGSIFARVGAFGHEFVTLLNPRPE